MASRIAWPRPHAVRIATVAAVMAFLAITVVLWPGTAKDGGEKQVVATRPLAPGDGEVGALLAARAASTTHIAYPTGEPAFDAAILQATIDGAGPGDTLILKSTNEAGEPTPWVLGRTTSEDFQVQTAEGPFWYYEDLRIPDNPPYSNPLPPGVRYQDINVHKPLTIRGETIGGSPSTVITVPPELRWSGVPGGRWGRIFTGVPGTFVINAMGVTIENLSFEYLVEPLWAFSPGFDINNNRFFRTAFHWLSPDVSLTYPHYPSYDAPVISYYRNNEIVESLQGPHVVGSETEVTDNVFDLLPEAGSHVGIPVIGWVAWAGSRLELPINLDVVQNNLIARNTIDKNHHGGGVWVTDGAGGTLRNNTVRDNVIRNCGENGRGVWLWARSPNQDHGIRGTVVSGNTIESCRWPLRIDAGRDAAAEENRITGNSVVNVVGPDFPGAGVAVDASGGKAEGNFVLDNDFTESGYPGWAADIGAVYLGSETKGNCVGNQKFPIGTTFCDQVRDDGRNAILPRRCRNDRR